MALNTCGECKNLERATDPDDSNSCRRAEDGQDVKRIGHGQIGEPQDATVGKTRHTGLGHLLEGQKENEKDGALDEG